LNAEIPHVNILLSNEKILAVVNILTAIMVPSIQSSCIGEILICPFAVLNKPPHIGHCSFSSASRASFSTSSPRERAIPTSFRARSRTTSFGQRRCRRKKVTCYFKVRKICLDENINLNLYIQISFRMHHLDVLFEPNTAQPPCYIHLGLHQLVCDLGQAVTDMMQISVHLDELAAEMASVSSIASCHTQLRVTDIGCRVIKHSQSLAVDGSITKITVEDKRDSVSYPLIIDTYTPDDLLKFEFKLFQSPIPSRRSQHLAASTVTRRLRVADTNQIAQTDMNLSTSYYPCLSS